MDFPKRSPSPAQCSQVQVKEESSEFIAPAAVPMDYQPYSTTMEEMAPGAGLSMAAGPRPSGRLYSLIPTHDHTSSLSITFVLSL